MAQKAKQRLQKTFEKPKQGTLTLAGAVVSFAIIITVLELPCSVGIPLAFSAILVEAEVSVTNYILYILIFLLFYLLDELIIFMGAVLTKKIWLAGPKTTTWATFIGSVVLFYLSYYYLFS